MAESLKSVVAGGGQVFGIPLRSVLRCGSGALSLPVELASNFDVCSVRFAYGLNVEGVETSRPESSLREGGF